eukprot:jgi/Hompol1/5122/HPOL_000433-RA
MDHHIKIMYHGNMYGPMRVPTTIKMICTVLKISPRASPTLQSLDRAIKLVIVDLDADVTSGFYELLVHPDIQYDEHIDGPVLRAASPDKSPISNRPQTRTLRTMHDGDSSETQTNQRSHHQHVTPHLPLGPVEMQACVESMMHLISSIPPRYVRYNKVLSNQLDHAMAEVNRLQKSLDHLLARSGEPSQPQPSNPLSPLSGEQDSKEQHQSSRRKSLPLSIQVTFMQYRIVHVLYETWKTVWKRFSPVIRSFNISKIQTLHSLQTSEHYLNRLWTWRRILDTNVWDRLTKDMAEQTSRANLLAKNPKNSSHVQSQSARSRLLDPPALPSGEHPRPWEYMVKPWHNTHSGPSIEQQLEAEAQGPCRIHADEKKLLRNFRQMFIDAILRHQVYKDEELDCFLNELIELDKGAVQSKFRGSNEDPDRPDLVYPTAFIRESIRREFQINWTSLDRDEVLMSAAQAKRDGVNTAPAASMVTKHASQITVPRQLMSAVALRSPSTSLRAASPLPTIPRTVHSLDAEK